MEERNINSDEIKRSIVSLASTTYAKVAEISEISNLLDNFLAKNPQNVTVAIYYLQTLVMLGKANDAINLAESIWNIGGSITKETEALYIYLLNSLCMFNYSKVLLEPKLKIEFSEQQKYPNLISLFITCYTGIGDLNALNEITKLNGISNRQKQILKGFVTQMTADGAREHFIWQQKKINEVIYKKCSAYEVLLSADNGYPEIEIGVFAGGDSVDRYQLQRNVDKVYNDYYEIVGYTPLDNFMLTVYDIKEHWGYDGTIDD